jgi:hypothetical protein
LCASRPSGRRSGPRSIGDDADWSYLLPSKLPKGSYVLEVKAIDAAGNAGEPAVKRFRVG